MDGFGLGETYTRFLLYALYPRRVRCDAAWAGLPLAFLYPCFERLLYRSNGRWGACIVDSISIG
jgi:hypothetical protein